MFKLLHFTTKTQNDFVYNDIKRDKNSKLTHLRSLNPTVFDVFA